MSIYPPSPDTTGGGPAPEQDPSVVISEIYSNWATSYCSLAFATQYFSNHWKPAFSTQWTALSADQQGLLLNAACSDIEQFRFVDRQAVPTYRYFVEPGYDGKKGKVLILTPTREPIKYNYYQSLQFPRSVDVHQDGSVFIPLNLQRAQCEQAIYKLNFDESILASARQGVSIDSAKVGGLSVYQHISSGGDNLAPSALAYIKPYLKYTRHLVRG
jgi:hypothetical protein